MLGCTIYSIIKQKYLKTSWSFITCIEICLWIRIFFFYFKQTVWIVNRILQILTHISVQVLYKIKTLMKTLTIPKMRRFYIFWQMYDDAPLDNNNRAELDWNFVADITSSQWWWIWWLWWRNCIKTQWSLRERVNSHEIKASACIWWSAEKMKKKKPC